jgi:hypothetical protein
MPDNFEDLRREISELRGTLGSQAYLLYAMGLRLNTLDYGSLATESLLDGPDDKKIDFFNLDFDNGVATVAQAYCAEDWDAPAPPANKAADLNTAVAWLLESDLPSIPRESVRAAAEQLRDALTSHEISRVEIYFVHNLRSSQNVDRELGTVQRTAQRLLDRYAGQGGTCTECVARQIDREQVDEWRRTTHQAVTIHDTVSLHSQFTPQELQSAEWQAVVAAIPAQQLVELRAKHGEALFSANVRDYLGSRQTARNINRQIERTAIDEPRNFWVYNNGITILTNGIRVEGNVLQLSGIAIINGAQTTGSLAQAAARGSVSEAAILVRAIRCNDPSLVDSVIRYNNTQNPIKAWELRVIDPIQRRLLDDFEKLGVTYQLRRGSGRRRASDVSYEQLGPCLSAFYGDPISAHKNKAELFENESRYRRLFDESTNVRNLLFIYRLWGAVARSKARLKAKLDAETATEDDRAKSQYFRYGAFAFVLIYVCSEVIGLLLGARDPTFKRRVVLEDALLKDVEKSEEFLSRLCDAALGPVHMHLKGKDAYQVLKTQSGAEAIATHAKTLIEQVHQMKPDTYDEFTKQLRLI